MMIKKKENKRKSELRKHLSKMREEVLAKYRKKD